MEVKKSFYTTVSHPFEIRDVEPVDCNLCGHTGYAGLGEENGFEIRECTRCGLVYVSPQPAAGELPAFYEAMYPDASEEEVRARSLGAVEGHLRRILLRRRPDGGRLLEVGCGYGLFLKRVEDLPWQATGLEMSETAAAYARAQLPNASILRTGLENAEIPARSQDCVVMVAVLEHVKDPHAAAARLYDWLAPGGLVVIQVPHIAGFIRLKRRLPWLPIHFEAPRHLFDFSPRTLSRYLEEAGFQDVQVEISRPYAAPGVVSATLIWGVKILGLALYALTGRRYIYPYAGGIVAHATKP